MRRKVYFIQMGEDGPIKIGSSSSPRSRLRYLRSGSPYPLHLIATIDKGIASERDLHKHFSHLRLEGEWFKPDRELLDCIADLQSGAKSIHEDTCKEIKVKLGRITPPRRWWDDDLQERSVIFASVDAKDDLDKISKMWGMSVDETIRYFVRLGLAGYISIPAPPHPIVIDYDIDKPPDDLEVEGVKFVRSICSPTLLREAETRIVELIRLAGCEARASWEAGEDDDDEDNV